MAEPRLLLLAVGLVLCARQSSSHPLCSDFTTPLLGGDAPAYEFCTALNGNPDGGCCTLEQEDGVRARFDEAVAAAARPPSDQCKAMLMEVLGPEDGMMLCRDFCQRYHDACAAALALPADFCAARSRAPDAFYCYPYAPRAWAAANHVADPAQPQLEPAFPLLQGRLPQLTGMVLRPDADAWWLLEQTGVVHELQNDPGAADFMQILDVSDRTTSGGELGLLGLAFHPNFAANGAFYVAYIGDPMATVVARFAHMPGDPEATAASEARLFVWPQAFQNHKAGWMAFTHADMAAPERPSHDLYMSTGDGGGGNDPNGNAQNPASPFGKMLRMRITQAHATAAAGAPLFEIPPDNPFANAAAGQQAALPGIVYARGLRNPWRCSFDRGTDALWCGDVGQDNVEEIDTIVKGGNYGWRDHEGERCNWGAPDFNCDLKYDAPLFQYCHSQFQQAPEPTDVQLSAAICKGQQDREMRVSHTHASPRDPGSGRRDGARAPPQARGQSTTGSTVCCCRPQTVAALAGIAYTAPSQARTRTAAAGPQSTTCSVAQHGGRKRCTARIIKRTDCPQHASRRPSPRTSLLPPQCVQVQGQSITGGVVYRGRALAAALGGAYVFADYEARLIAAIRRDGGDGGAWHALPVAGPANGAGQVSAFAEDRDGEVLVVSYNPPAILRCGGAPAH
ncbi:Sorbosone dehydrogenase-domain-containing protein [Tribonema minus]|uniref:Sorbosone dehydrogenase-domain-containing protein n=1 Tax=Tribonema minus TaxID=303371 RepID=A0A836CDA7_9STRA|nr:Sorbosone dehydrogenase-domain-containing protein [Tribonema minus]